MPGMSQQSETQGSISVLGLISPAVVLCIWETAGALGWVNTILLPRPSQIVQSLFELVADGAVVSPLIHTVVLFLVGYCLASIIGIALGVAMAMSQVLYGLFEPLVEIVRPIPKSALVPVLFLFLGIGKATMVVIVVLAAVFPILISTFQGVRGLDPVLLETARTFQVSRWRTIFSIVLPASLPMILAGMRVALGLGLVLVILAEMLAGEDGIGFRVLDLQRAFQIREMFAWIFVLVVLGGGLMLLFDKIERRLVPWRGKT
jgi:ABC-type nitrate/sulfonate/bicarbonate transport system permease component